MDTTAATNTEQTQVPAPQAAIAQVAKVKEKAQKTGNLILDVASGVETLTKVKALNRADKLVEDIDNNSFELGGILKVIFDQGWHEGFESFGDFVFEKYGFQERKARYLMEIYDALVTKNIPWEKVAPLGWTKIKDLAKILTPENVDQWVEKAKLMTVKELQAALKANQPAADGETKTASDAATWKVKLKTDQLETVSSAMSKGKAEMGTEFDSVVLENLCAGYLGGSVTAAKAPSLADIMKSLGWEQTLQTFGEIFPDLNVEVGVASPPEAAKA
jgi:hypothetical protein